MAFHVSLFGRPPRAEREFSQLPSGLVRTERVYTATPRVDVRRKTAETLKNWQRNRQASGSDRPLW